MRAAHSFMRFSFYFCAKSNEVLGLHERLGRARLRTRSADFRFRDLHFEKFMAAREEEKNKRRRVLHRTLAIKFSVHSHFRMAMAF